MDESKVMIQALNADWYAPYVAGIDMLRLDLIDPVISGNKWYKLKHNLQYAAAHSYKSILTFGGPYSNHLVATAAAAKLYGLNAAGVVRGNDGGELTSSLQSCRDNGMQLHFVSREEYGKKNDKQWLQQLSMQYGDPFIIPEGGANEQGRAGAMDIARLIPGTYSHVAVSVGTGTTFAGIRTALPAVQNILAFAPIKNGAYLQDEMAIHLNPVDDTNWQLFDRWHFGGFGKHKEELLAFMNEFYHSNHIPLDVVYTAKMMYGIRDLLRANYFQKNAKILCIHTGGLQGNTSVSGRLVYKSGI